MKRALLLLLAAAAVFAVFSPLLRAPFLFDDHTVIEGDEAIVEAEMAEDGDGRDVDLWRNLWRKPRPLRQLSHRIEWRLAGDSPALPHATNILLHLAVAAAGWLLLKMNSCLGKLSRQASKMLRAKSTNSTSELIRESATPPVSL